MTIASFIHLTLLSTGSLQPSSKEPFILVETPAESVSVPRPSNKDNAEAWDLYFQKRNYWSLRIKIGDREIPARVSPDVLPVEKMRLALSSLKVISDGIRPDGTLSGEAQKMMLSAFSASYGSRIDSNATVSLGFMRSATVSDGTRTIDCPMTTRNTSTLIDKHKDGMAKPVREENVAERAYTQPPFMLRLRAVPDINFAFVHGTPPTFAERTAYESVVAEHVAVLLEEYESARKNLVAKLADGAKINDAGLDADYASLGGSLSKQPKFLADEIRKGLRGTTQLFRDENDRMQFAESAKVTGTERKVIFSVMVSLNENNRAGWWSLGIDEKG